MSRRPHRGQDSGAATISLTHEIVTKYLFFKRDKAVPDEYLAALYRTYYRKYLSS
jgi:hypothetical protein